MVPSDKGRSQTNSSPDATGRCGSQVLLRSRAPGLRFLPTFMQAQGLLRVMVTFTVRSVRNQDITRFVQMCPTVAEQFVFQRRQFNEQAVVIVPRWLISILRFWRKLIQCDVSASDSGCEITNRGEWISDARTGSSAPIRTNNTATNRVFTKSSILQLPNISILALSPRCALRSLISNHLRKRACLSGSSGPIHEESPSFSSHG